MRRPQYFPEFDEDGIMVTETTEDLEVKVKSALSTMTRATGCLTGLGMLVIYGYSCYVAKGLVPLEPLFASIMVGAPAGTELAASWWPKATIKKPS